MLVNVVRLYKSQTLRPYCKVLFMLNCDEIQEKDNRESYNITDVALSDTFLYVHTFSGSISRTIIDIVL